MGTANPFESVKVVIGILFNSQISLEPILDGIRTEFWEIDFLSSVLDFDYSSYYEPEMGAPLKRCFVSLKHLIPAEESYRLKLKSNDLEMSICPPLRVITRKKLLEDVRRPTSDVEFHRSLSEKTGLKEDGTILRCVNLDPGVLSKHNLILLTTKNYSHRIPLQAGIYGEVTLIWSQKQFQDLPWTYPDYRSAAYKGIFSEIRKLF